MADKKIADLTEATTAADTDIFIVEDNANTKKMTWANLKTAIIGAFSSILGNRTYTEQNVVTNGESVTSSIDKLDMAVPLMESGSFTPTFTFGGNNVGMVLNIVTARYYRTGNQVLIRLGVLFSNKGSSVGKFKIGGLPYECEMLPYGDFVGSGFGTIINSDTFVPYVVDPTSIEIKLNTGIFSATNNDFRNDTFFILSIVYGI